MSTREPKKRPNIYKRGRRWWITYTSADGRRYFESAKQKEKGIDGTRLEDAIRLLNERQGDIAKGVPASPAIGRGLFSDAVQDVLKDHERNKRRSTADTKRRIDLHIAPYFGTRRLSEVTTRLIRSYVEHRQSEGAENATINRELAIIRRAFRLAHRTGHVLMVPHIEFLDESRNARQGFVEPEQFDRLHKHIAPAVYADVARFAFITGWRIPSEVLTLTWPQVNMNRGLIRLEPGTSKAGEGRTFPITTALQTLLKRRQRAAINDCALVFHDSGQSIERRRFHKAWEAAREAAKIATVVPHDLRRSAVRQLERARIPRKVAMQMVGHRTESIYRRYHIVAESDVHAAGASLDALTKAGAGVTDSLQSRGRRQSRQTQKRKVS